MRKWWYCVVCALELQIWLDWRMLNVGDLVQPRLLFLCHRKLRDLFLAMSMMKIGCNKCQLQCFHSFLVQLVFFWILRENGLESSSFENVQGGVRLYILILWGLIMFNYEEMKWIQEILVNKSCWTIQISPPIFSGRSLLVFWSLWG